MNALRYFTKWRFFAILLILSCSNNPPHTVIPNQQTHKANASRQHVKQPESAVPKTTFDCLADSKSMFWKLIGPKNNIYLLGSIHIGVPQLYPLPDTILSAFRRAKHIVLEVDLTDTAFAVELATLATMFLFNDGRTLKTTLSDSAYKLTQKALSDVGMSILKFERYKPWAVSILLTQMTLANMGILPQYGVESYFISLKDTLQQFHELESVRSQFTLLDTYLNNEAFLTYSILSLALAKSQMNTLLKAWKCGDTKTMEELLFSQIAPVDSSHLKVIYEKLFFERNKKMAQRIFEYLNQTEDYFIIVGTGHLIGPNSILEILKDKGFALQQQ